jgi:hypothetical protein
MMVLLYKSCYLRLSILYHYLLQYLKKKRKEKKRKEKQRVMKNKVFDITRLSILYHYLLQFYIETPHLLRKKKI